MSMDHRGHHQGGGTIPPINVSKPVINKILKDLDVLLKLRNPEKRLQKSRELIIFIVSSLRHRGSDHLLETTAVWALINICRADGGDSR